MVEEMIKELDKKVEFLINKNVQYTHEITRLRGLLDEANSKIFAAQKESGVNLDELKPLADSILARIEKTNGE
jgi:regulator of replication initiation timing